MTQQPKRAVPLAPPGSVMGPPPKQVTYPAVQIAVQPLPDGGVVLLMEAPDEVLIFPMSAEAAESIGKQLSAPRIAVAPLGGPRG